MNRIARVARTAHDLDHVNRLRFPSFQIVDLTLKAGAKTSKCHLPGGPKGAGSDDFHFVPEHETIEINYEIDDPFGVADGGKIEFFTRFDDTALWTLDLGGLGPDWVSHGKHSIKWDGRTVKPTAPQAATETVSGATHDLTALSPDKTLHADFPDGYMTIQHGPYKVRLTVSTSTEPELQKRPALAWTYFHILIKSIELVLGEKELVPAVTVDDDQHKRDEAVRKQIETDGGIPADTATVPRKVILTSNLFKTDANQMNDDTAFDVHKTMWGKGPNIPIVAKIRLAASDDVEVKIDETPKGAVALGKAKFLWDWEDPAETFTQGGKPKDFITAATDYYKATTGPKGDNCHLDRGGKRGTGADAVFPKQDGYAANATLTNGKFPFKVDVAGTRTWASLSEGWTSGKLKGCTGAVFQPSRMGGDDYVLQVYLAYDKSAKDKLALDADTQPLVTPAVIKKKTGRFQVWRQVDIARYVRKNSSITDFSTEFGTAATDYEVAYTILKDLTGTDDKYLVTEHKNPVAGSSAIDYNALCERALLDRNQWIFNEHIVSDAAADHSSVNAAFKLRTYEDMVKRAHTVLNDGFTSGYNITAIARTAGVVTVEVGPNHGFEVDDRIYIDSVHATDFDGEYKVSGTTADGVTYADARADASPAAGTGAIYFQPAERDLRAVAARTSSTVKQMAWELGTASLPAPTSTPVVNIDPAPVVFRLKGIATLQTTAPHGLSAGDDIAVTGVGDSSFDGTFKVKETKSTTEITVENTGPTAASGGGEIGASRLLTPAVTKRALANGMATITMASAHGLAVGDKVKIEGVTPAEFNGDFEVKTKTPTEFTVENDAFKIPEAASGGTIVNITPAAPVTAGISKVARAGAEATFTTGAPHGLEAGKKVRVAGVATAGFNGEYTLKSRTDTSFTVDCAGDDLGETAATGTITNITTPPPVPGLTRVALSAGVATFTTGTAHGLEVGMKVRIAGATPSGLNGEYLVKTKTDTTFTADCKAGDRPVANSSGKVTKTVKLTIAAAKAAGAEKTAAGCTVRTTTDHGYSLNDSVVISGVGAPSMNGTFRIKSVPTTKSFTIDQGGDDVMSGGGTVQITDDEEMARLGLTQTWLKDWKFDTVVQYSKNMNFKMPGTQLVSLLQLMAGGKTGAGKDGVTIMHFDNVHSIVAEVESASPRPADYRDMIYLLGEAIDVTDANRNRCAFVFYRSDVQTFVHEVGHHLFLPHAKYPTTGNNIPGGSQENRHDDDDERCIMSYNHPTNKFCGLCQLRLRGWTALQLKKDDADNKKP
jgi:hypothetical protein